MDELLRRYRAGDHARVWKELTPADGLDVARETMSRVRTNIELLERRLRETGYAFAEDICPAFAPPPPDQADTIRRVEAAFGPLPLALKCFYETVGAVDFRTFGGEYAGEPWSRMSLADPLVVWPLGETFDSNFDDWESLSDDERQERGSFTLDFSPDRYHKDDVSGDAPYGIALPTADVDPRVQDPARRITFVEHLRLAIRNGGFLGMDSQSVALEDAVKKLTKDLLPF